jgi:hypothetical protein
MLIRPYCWDIDQRSHRDVNISSLSNHGINQGPAYLAVGVVAIAFAEDHEVPMPLCENQLPAFDASERLERRTRRATAVGAMAICRVEKLIGNRVSDGATKAFSGK